MLAPGGDQAADRARGGRRGGGLPLLPRRHVGHRQQPRHGRRVERPLSARPARMPPATRSGRPGRGGAATRRPAAPRSSSSCSSRTPRRSSSSGRWSARGPAAPTRAELAELERVKALALAVREAFAARRRRESELTALFDTASDLAALRGVDSVLTAIVRRARQLLGTDVSYLTLNDDAARPHLHAGHRRHGVGPLPGAAAADGRGARRPGRPDGRALRDGRTTSPTRRFRHTAEINDGVRDEGLVAILGVPLIRGSQVIGVLYAADRSERSFDRSEVALLGSLAAHAAIALDNARLLEETRTALDELSAATRELRAHTRVGGAGRRRARPVHRRRPARRRRRGRRRRGDRGAGRLHHRPRRGGPGDARRTPRRPPPGCRPTRPARSRWPGRPAAPSATAAGGPPPSRSTASCWAGSSCTGTTSCRSPTSASSSAPPWSRRCSC